MTDKYSTFISSKKFNEDLGITFNNGWSPVLKLEEDPTVPAIYLKFSSWVGGEGDTPTTPAIGFDYLTENGFGQVTDAVNIIPPNGIGLQVDDSGASLPASGTNAGDTFYNTTDTTLYIWDGTTWNAVPSGTTYTLPTASGSVLGGIKVGSGLAIDGTGILSTTASVGEANLGTNLGTGEEIYYDKSGVNLRFKSLKAGTNVGLSSTSSEITISATGEPTTFEQLNANGDIDDTIGTSNSKVAIGNHTHPELEVGSLGNYTDLTVTSDIDWSTSGLNYKTALLKTITGDKVISIPSASTCEGYVLDITVASGSDTFTINYGLDLVDIDANSHVTIASDGTIWFVADTTKPATTTAKGIASIVSTGDIEVGTNNTDIITPLRLRHFTSGGGGITGSLSFEAGGVVEWKKDAFGAVTIYGTIVHKTGTPDAPGGGVAFTLPSEYRPSENIRGVIGTKEENTGVTVIDTEKVREYLIDTSGNVTIYMTYQTNIQLIFLTGITFRADVWT